MSKAHRQLSLPIVTRPKCDEPDEPHPNEFRPGAASWDTRFSRRTFMQTMTASMALAGLYGCSDRPKEAIVPYIDQPEQMVPGEPMFFATALTRAGYARGVLVTSHEGRPTKIEGNPDHPASLGSADAAMQAAVLSLYDPKRSQTVTHAGQASMWGAFSEALKQNIPAEGDGLCILMGATSSPTQIDQLQRLLKRYPKTKLFTSEPLDRANIRQGAKLAFGVEAEPVYHLDRCKVIVSFGSDFLWDEPGSLAYARQFADGRRTHANAGKMSRLYVAESAFSLTGTKADHRIAVTPDDVARLASAVSDSIAGGATRHSELPPAHRRWVDAVASELLAAKGESLVIAGESQPAEVHHLVNAINASLRNSGKTVDWIAPITDQSPLSVAELLRAIDQSEAKAVLIFCENPVRHSPSDLTLAESLKRMSLAFNADGSAKYLVAHHGLYANETAFVSQWHVPAQHTLETWSDARAYEGSVSFIQPLIAPLYQGKTVSDVLGVLLGEPELSPYETVRRYWRSRTKLNETDAFEIWWNQSLRRGVIEGSASPPLQNLTVNSTRPPASLAASRSALNLVLRPDYSIGDGADFQNPWLQELPRPLTKIVWGNAALISPATAKAHNLVDHDVVRLGVGERSIESPVILLPGVADDVVVLDLGYGEHRLYSDPLADQTGTTSFGVDAYRLQTLANPWTAPLTLEKVGRQEHVVRTHNHHAMSVDEADPSVKVSLTPQVVATPETSEDVLALRNRKLIRAATLAQQAEHPNFVRKMDGEPIKSLYNVWDYSKGEQWGMTIDLTACIGCNACVVACQSENNIPVVGREQVDREREMHWIRIDNYVAEPKDADASPQVFHQPVPCMHCENAPCEYVCPVAATSHSVDGLNQMTYNRCVGTRYCSNNCPYKVRRFNFFNYTKDTKPTFGMQHNPDVTVRTLGVMEKCTYCVQRIVYARRKSEVAQVNAEAAGATDDLTHSMFERLETACQQTCPTRAIAFGDIRDPKTEVAKLKADLLNYGLLEELTTKPRTTYLAHLSNPNPALEQGSVSSVERSGGPA